MTSALQGSAPILRRFLRNPLGLAGALLAALLTLAALAAPALVRAGLLHDPILQHSDGLDPDGFPLTPGGRFPLGTDPLGRDVLSRVIHGARVSLAVGFGGILTATVIGVGFGLVAGYRGGWPGAILLRLTELGLSIPAILLAVAMTGLVDRSPSPLPSAEGGGFPSPFRLSSGISVPLFVVGLVCWPGMVRVVRAQVLQLKEREFVVAARTLGASGPRVVLRHILPNLIPTVLILASMNTAYAILLEAGLGYLGLGVPPPAPAWGSMINEGQSHLITSPHLIAAPGIAIVFAVLGFNLTGQALKETLEPGQR